VTYPADVLPAFVAELDVPLADPVRRVLHEAVDLGDTGYPEPGALSAAFTGFVAGRHDWAVDEADVHLVGDVMAGVAEVLRVMTDPGDAVVINPPVYPPFVDTLAEVDRPVVRVPLARDGGPDRSGWTLDLAGLEAAFRDGARAYLLCSPHNPVGRVWSEAELRAVAELADRYGVLVLSDEIHAPLVLPGTRHLPYPAVAGGGAECVAFHSASKAWNLAGLKCALAVTNGAAGRAAFDRMPREVPYRTSIFGVLAGAAAYAEGGRWLDSLLAHLDRNRRLLGELLADRLPDAGYRVPEASFLAWLDLRAYGLGDDPAAVLLDRGRVALQSGPTFGAEGAGFARLNYGTSRVLLTETVDRMAAAVR
jgi:cystathionine beta-lyase